MLRCAPLLLLALATQADGKKARTPDWDCSVEISEGGDSWKASDFDVEWHRFTSTNAQFSFSAVTFNKDELRRTLRESGPLDPSLLPGFYASPHIASAKRPLWAAVAAGNHKLPPMPVDRYKGFYAGVSIPLADMRAMLDGDADIVVTFYFENSQILDRIAISPADLLAMVNRLRAVAETYEMRMAHPEGQCVDHNQDIMIVD